MDSGRYTFLELLDATQTIRIPKVQRDYAQGRNDADNSSLYSDIRKSFLDSFRVALLNDQKVILDYIYGSIDASGNFELIDGQQRLTSLFLLYWYIGKGEDKLDEDKKKLLKKFTYEIRDTTQEFCESLLDMNVDVNDLSIVKQIRNSKLYFSVFDTDSSVSSMLRMISEIHNAFKEKKGLWDRLDNISFWVLPLEKYGLTDDIFVKMNARGRRLTRFDVFKSDLESVLDKEYANNQIVNLWEREIDNQYLDSFFRVFGKTNLERNVYRTILFFSKCLISIEKSGDVFDDSWEVHDSSCPYSDVISFLTSDLRNLETICRLLDTFPFWYDRDNCILDSLTTKESSLLIPKNPLSDYEPKMIRGDNKVKIFGILYWFSIGLQTKGDQDFLDFKRVLSNYLFTRRQFNNGPRNYSSIIDNKNIGKELLFIKQLIDEYSNCSCLSFYEYIKSTNYEELTFEREKLAYCDLQQIIALEKVPQLSTLIDNFFFDNEIKMDACTLSKILEDKELKNMSLRIILSFADKQYGQFKNLVFDAITKQSGSRQLEYNSEGDWATSYCHKYFFAGDDAEYGDHVLSASIKGSGNQEKSIAESVRKFVVTVGDEIEKGEDVKEALRCVLNDRIALLEFDDESESILPYIVKYEEFFYDQDYATFLVLRRKDYTNGIDDDNVYDIRCINRNYNLYSSPHYQPFYKALANTLEEKGSTIRVSSGIEYIGSQIEYKHPCTLTDGRIVRIKHNGCWTIDDNDVSLPKGVDVIEAMAEFIMNNVSNG